MYNYNLYLDWLHREDSYKDIYIYLKNILTSETIVLEVGCGGGVFLNILNDSFPGIITVGIDLSEKMIHNSRYKIKNVILSSSTHLPFRNNIFNFAIAHSLLHHVVSKSLSSSLFLIKKSIDDMITVLKNDGDLIIREGIASRSKIFRNIIFYFLKLFSKYKITSILVRIKRGENILLLTPSELLNYSKNLQLILINIKKRGRKSEFKGILKPIWESLTYRSIFVVYKKIC